MDDKQPNHAAQPLKIVCRHCQQKLDASLLEPFSRISCPVCGTMLRIPKPFGRYQLEKLCGIGGMSKVYRAIDPDNERRVAIKILNPEFYAECHDAEQFLYESRLVAQIEHPGVIPIYDCGVIDTQPYLVMRYMARGSIENHLRTGTLPGLPVLLWWFFVTADALAQALSQNILHHDIKPGNIMIDDEGHPGLGDFDLADLRQNIETLLASTGWASPGYVSPERLQTGREDWPGDIFSLGITMYETLTGTLPFGLEGDTQELLDRRKAGQIAPITDFVPELTPQFAELIVHMLAFAPEDRPQYPEILEILGEEVEHQRANLGFPLDEWLK